MDYYKLQLPILGEVLWKLEVSRFARILGTLLQNGVSLLRSLEIVHDILVNQHLAGLLSQVRNTVKEGESLSGLLNQNGFLPDLAGHLIRVGEESGNMDAMLIRVGDIYDDEAQERIKRLIAFVEPGLIVIMGLLIGGVVISMLSAIFSINDISF